MKNVYIIENENTTSIIDIMGNIRYIVQLEQGETLDKHGKTIAGYATFVLRCNDDEKIIVDRYPTNDEYDSNYVEVRKIFSNQIKKFLSLVEAETCNLDETTIYKERINYEITKPKCCNTCKWCRKHKQHNKSHDKCCSDQFFTYECHNPDNQQIFIYHLHEPIIDNKHKHCKHEAWSKLPWQKPTTPYTFNSRGELPLNKMFINIDPFGICDNYEKNATI